MLALVLASVGLLAQSEPVETDSNPAVVVVGVLIVTAVIITIVIRRSKR